MSPMRETPMRSSVVSDLVTVRYQCCLRFDFPRQGICSMSSFAFFPPLMNTCFLCQHLLCHMSCGPFSDGVFPLPSTSTSIPFNCPRFRRTHSHGWNPGAKRSIATRRKEKKTIVMTGLARREHFTTSLLDFLSTSLMIYFYT